MSYQRIISLVPSLTELIIDLGLEDRLYGRTRFCTYPEEKIEDIQIIGGTKNPNIDKILSLEPGLVIANKEENRKEDIEALADHCEVVVTEIKTVEEALWWIEELGYILGVRERASSLTQRISGYLDKKPEMGTLSVAYLIWKDPWMTIGSDTYIHDVLKNYDLWNVYSNEARYPKTNLEELAANNPQLILLSSEPYPFKENHVQEIQQACPNSTIQLIDGEWFSWYGSRMESAFQKLNNWRQQL